MASAPINCFLFPSPSQALFFASSLNRSFCAERSFCDYYMRVFSICVSSPIVAMYLFLYWMHTGHVLENNVLDIDYINQNVKVSIVSPSTQQITSLLVHITKSHSYNMCPFRSIDDGTFERNQIKLCLHAKKRVTDNNNNNNNSRPNTKKHGDPNEV